MSLFKRFRVGLRLFWRVMRGKEGHCVISTSPTQFFPSHAQGLNFYRALKTEKAPAMLVSFHLPAKD